MELAQTLSLSERQIRTALDKLKMSGVIAIKATNQYSLITVENYNCFQDCSVENVQLKAKQPTNPKSAESPTNDQPRVRPRSTTQEKKNLKTKISSLHSDILIYLNDIKYCIDILLTIFVIFNKKQTFYKYATRIRK